MCTGLADPSPSRKGGVGGRKGSGVFSMNYTCAAGSMASGQRTGVWNLGPNSDLGRKLSYVISAPAVLSCYICSSSF